jgi:hypothetical protein
MLTDAALKALKPHNKMYKVIASMLRFLAIEMGFSRPSASPVLGHLHPPPLAGRGLDCGGQLMRA